MRACQWLVFRCNIRFLCPTTFLFNILRLSYVYWSFIGRQFICNIFELIFTALGRDYSVKHSCALFRFKYFIIVHYFAFLTKLEVVTFDWRRMMFWRLLKLLSFINYNNNLQTNMHFVYFRSQNTQTIIKNEKFVSEIYHAGTAAISGFGLRDIGRYTGVNWKLRAIRVGSKWENLI